MHLHDPTRDAVLEANRKLEAIFRSGDARAVGNLYTDQARLFPPGAKSLSGAAAIADFWSAVMGMGITEIQLETLELDLQGQTAIETGEYILKNAAGEKADQGK